MCRIHEDDLVGHIELGDDWPQLKMEHSMALPMSSAHSRDVAADGAPIFSAAHPLPWYIEAWLALIPKLAHDPFVDVSAADVTWTPAGDRCHLHVSRRVLGVQVDVGGTIMRGTHRITIILHRAVTLTGTTTNAGDPAPGLRQSWGAFIDREPEKT